MAIHFWKGFYLICSRCGHKNRPHKSPREGVRLTLTGKAGSCRGCGKKINPRLSDRPLIRKVRAQLQAAGIKTIC